MALAVAAILKGSGRAVDMIVFIDGSPPVFASPAFREYSMSPIKSSAVDEEVVFPHH